MRGERPYEPGSLRSRASGLVRVLVALLMALSLSGLLHGAEEAIESAVHIADTGHGAHAGDHPEGEADPGQEHFCFGAVHNCGCCPTAVAAPVSSMTFALRATERLQPRRADDDMMLDGIQSRIDRPPRVLIAQ